MERPKTTKNVGQPCVICGQSADAQATIAALQDIIKQMGGQAAVLAKDAMAAKEQVAALQARVQELCKFRVADHEQLAEVQKYWRESQDEAHELRKQLTQRTAELEAAKQHHEQSENAAQLYYRELTRAKNRICEAAGLPPDSGYEPAIKHLQAELERVRAERDHAKKMEAVQKEVADNQTWHVQQLRAELERVKQALCDADERANEYQKALHDFESERALPLSIELERVRGLVKTYAAAKIDFDDKRLQEDHHAWRERYTRLVGAETILIALTATSQEVL